MVSSIFVRQIYIILVWLTVQCHAEEICVVGSSIKVVPICTSVTLSSHTIAIDTSAVPANSETDCNCSIEFGQSISIDIFYQPLRPGNPLCGLQFWLGNLGFSCDDIQVAITKPFEKITFSKTTNDADACLIISIDRLHPNKTAANLTCYGTSVSTSSYIVETTTVETFALTSETVSVFSTESTNDVGSSTSMLQGSTTSGNGTESDNKSDDKSSNTVIIGAAAGGGGAVLIVVSIVIICCLRNRCKNSNKDLPSKHTYVNTMSDEEVTDNVVYNMEFQDETKHPHMPLDTIDATYNTIDDDTQQKAEANSSMPAVYSNLQVGDERGTYNTVDLDQNQHTKKMPMSVKCNNLQANDAAGLYNAVDLNNENPDIQTSESCNSSLQPALDNNSSNNVLGHEPDTETISQANDSVAEQNPESYITYAVVNKTKADDEITRINRPAQLQVASGDTYAVVNKKSEK